MTAVESTPTFSQPKIVEKAFSLPVVLDTYSYGLQAVSSLTSSLSASLPSSLASLSPVVSSQLASIKSLGEDRLPEVLYARLHSVRDQAAACAQSLDSTLCLNFDQLLDKAPILKSSTPALYSSTKEAAVSHLTLATTYLASFTLAQLALKVSDHGLETADSLLKMVPASYEEQCQPLVSGLKRVRSEAATVRREGARANGTKKVLAMEDSSLLSSVSEVLGLHYVLSLFLLSETIAKTDTAAEVIKDDTPAEVAKEAVAAEVAKEPAAAEVAKEVAATEVVEEVIGDLSALKKGRKGNKN